MQRDLANLQKDLKRKCQLRSGCATRWNSYLVMFQSLVANKAPLEKLEKEKYGIVLFTDIQWQYVKLFIERYSILAAFTKELEQQSTCTINLVFPYLHQIKKNFDDNFDDLSIIVSFQYGKNLEKYFQISDNINNSLKLNKILVLGCFFDVRTKAFDFLDENWAASAISLCKKIVTQLISQSPQLPTKEISTTSPLMILKKGIHLSCSDEPEFMRYLQVNCSKNEDINVLNWWKDHEKDFPKLSKLARSFLSIPASSSAAERVFSITK